MGEITHIGAIVQARMTSRRLPGKVLREIQGKPLLQYLLERLRRCRKISEILVATSSDSSDDPVEELCRRQKTICHRAALTDVAGRFLQTLDAHPMEAFVRVSGDSPLLDPQLVERAVEMFREGEWDLVTNVQVRTFPPGQSVEVVRTEAFRNACREFQDPQEREHPTLHFYRHPEKFRIRNFRAGCDYTGVRLAVDTAEDEETIAAVCRRMERPHWEYSLDEIVEIYRQVRPLRAEGIRP